MNREEAAELLPIIKAFSEGKVIESRSKRFKEDWKEVTEIHGFAYISYEFRIKPVPKYRPFKDAEECWQEMQKHEPFGWVKHKKDGSRSLITSVIGYERKVYFDEDGWYFDRIMEHYTFADGTPFGVKVEE